MAFSESFSENVLDEAYSRAGGRCECTREHEGVKAPHHGKNCPRGFARYFGWLPYEKTPLSKGGKETFDNCEVLCKECNLLVTAQSPAGARS